MAKQNRKGLYQKRCRLEMKKIIYKLLSIEYKDTKEGKEEAEQTLKLFESVESVKIKDIGKVGGGFRLGKGNF